MSLWVVWTIHAREHGPGNLKERDTVCHSVEEPNSGVVVVVGIFPSSPASFPIVFFSQTRPFSQLVRLWWLVGAITRQIPEGILHQQRNPTLFSLSQPASWKQQHVCVFLHVRLPRLWSSPPQGLKLPTQCPPPIIIIIIKTGLLPSMLRGRSLLHGFTGVGRAFSGSSTRAVPQQGIHAFPPLLLLLLMRLLILILIISSQDAVANHDPTSSSSVSVGGGRGERESRADEEEGGRELLRLLQALLLRLLLQLILLRRRRRRRRRWSWSCP